MTAGAAPWLRWLALLAISAALGGLLLALHFPAAVLLGCMVAGIFLSIQLGPLEVPKPVFGLAQGVLGCLMAQSMQPAALRAVLAHWPLFLGINLLVIAHGAGRSVDFLGRARTPDGLPGHQPTSCNLWPMRILLAEDEPALATWLVEATDGQLKVLARFPVCLAEHIQRTSRKSHS